MLHRVSALHFFIRRLAVLDTIALLLYVSVEAGCSVPVLSICNPSKALVAGVCLAWCHAIC